MTGKDNSNYNKNYLEYVHQYSPKTKKCKTYFNSFMVGGLICCIGQFIRYMFQYWLNLEGDELAGSTSIVLIFLGAFLTGLGVYDRIGKHAGGGSIVPITGFANSVASPAIEFKSEGFINGVAAKMLIIAGPIIIYAIISGVAVGLIYLLI